MNQPKTTPLVAYRRKPVSVKAKPYEVGDEDGILVTRFKGKVEPVNRFDKHYPTYQERIDFITHMPYIDTPTGPLYIERGDMIVICPEEGRRYVEPGETFLDRYERDSDIILV